MHRLKRLHHDAFQLAVDLVFVPEELCQVLHPLEIRHRDAAGVGQNVGQHQHIIFVKNGVSAGRGRPVGRLSHDLGAHPRRVLQRDLVFQRCRHQDVALQLQHGVAGDGLRAGVAFQRPVLQLMRFHRGHVQALAVEQALV